MPITFDDSLPAFLQALTHAEIEISPAAGVVVRDSRGHLSFVSAKRISADVAERVLRGLQGDLIPYISPLGPIADQDAPGGMRVLDDDSGVLLPVKLEGVNEGRIIRLLDRRAVGGDWLHPPSECSGTPPRLVFGSLKGGVGRSTALSVLAADLADRGRTLLVLDLDMEAPGIGSMLIDGDATPQFGSIDFFVESGLTEIADEFVVDCIGASWLGGGRGRIDVVPALGSKSIHNPAGVLAKLARAYLETPGESEAQVTFLGRTQEFVRRLTDINRYDAVLIDARAGLHETTAAAILGLGADILLFGVDQRQTIVGYKVLLSHLAQFPSRSIECDWRYRLRMIQAKAEPSGQSLDRYRLAMHDLFDSAFYSRELAGSDMPGSSFRFSVDDADGPHFPIPIFDDDSYRLFDPVQDRAQLAQDLYKKSFGSFIEFCTDRLQINEDDES